MPMIDVTMPRGALDPASRDELMDALTETLLRNEGAPDSEWTRAMTWGFIREVPEVYLGGRPVSVPIYRVEITVPEGTLLHGPGPFQVEARRKLVAEVTERVLAAEGGAPSPHDRGRVYCLIREIPDGYWGGMGTTVRMEEIAAIATADSELARSARAAIEELGSAAGASA